jgi:DNA-binding GntR family transcriptional regulator
MKEKPLVEFTLLFDRLSFAKQFLPEVPICTQIMWSKVVPGTETAAKALNVKHEAPTLLMRRLRFVNDRPLMIWDSQLSAERFQRSPSGSLSATVSMPH